jgi:tRNA threonylcarbamoyladenosine biosynthesis protein TsaB
MILAVNTTTMQFSLALMKNQGDILAEYLMAPGGKKFKGFMPEVHSLLTSSQADTQDIKAIIVAIGPGSFTGLRVGLSAAKGMAQGLEIPIIGVSSLEAMATQLPFTEHPLCPMIASRKGEVFTALFKRSDDHRMIRQSRDISLKLEEMPSIIVEKTLFLGNDFISQGDVIKETLGTKALLAPPYLWNLRASAVGSLGLARFLDQDYDDLQDLVPAYLRPPDIRPAPFPFIVT